MNSIVLSSKKNDGTPVTLEVKALSPAVKTILGGKSYTLGGLFELATEGEISEENVSSNEALDTVSKDEAIDMIQDMVAHKSPFIEIIKEEVKEGKPKKEEK